MITFGNTSVEISLIAVFVAVLMLKLLPIIAVIWFAVQGFRVHWGWGVANLLIPVAIIPFCILHPKESKKPLILFGIWLGGFLILWICARHGSSSLPRVEVAPALSASATNAVLYLQLVSSGDIFGTNRTQTVTAISGISGTLNQRRPVMSGGHSNNGEQRLIVIRADGFVIQFTDDVGGEMRTNLVLFPYGQITETNTLGWSIVGDYSGKVASWPNLRSAEPTSDSAFRLLTTNGYTAPSIPDRSEHL